MPPAPRTGPENLAAALDALGRSRELLDANRQRREPGGGYQTEQEREGDRHDALVEALLGIGYALAANTLATALVTPGVMGRRDPVELRRWRIAAGRLPAEQ